MISYKLGLDKIDWTSLFSLYEKTGLLKRFIENKEIDKIKTAFQSKYLED